MLSLCQTKNIKTLQIVIIIIVTGDGLTRDEQVVATSNLNTNTTWVISQQARKAALPNEAIASLTRDEQRQTLIARMSIITLSRQTFQGKSGMIFHRGFFARG